MNRELASYLFFDVPLYKNPVSHVAHTEKPNVVPERSNRVDGVENKEKAGEIQVPLVIPKTIKKHAWFLGEKPTGGKKELLVKLLAAVQLKGSDIEFFFEKQPVFPIVETNPSLETVFIFGQDAVLGELIQPVNKPQLVRNTSLILTYSLNHLIANTTFEKRNLWEILKKVYLEAGE